MHINAIHVEEYGSGLSVTVRFHIGNREELEESDIARIVEAAKELAQAKEPEQENDNDEKVPTPQARTHATRGDAGRGGTSRRRGRAAPAAEAEKADDGARDTAPRGRGRRSAASSNGGDAAPSSRANRSRAHKTTAEATSRVGGRTRRAKKDTEPEITDVDLTKAASEAAAEITPNGVRKIIAEFKVNQIADILQNERQKFLDCLNDATEAGDEIPY